MKAWLQTIFLVVAIVAANCQCALTCVSEIPKSEESAPPCHGPASQEQKDVPENCAHSPVVAEEGSASISASFPAVFSHPSYLPVTRDEFFSIERRQPGVFLQADASVVSPPLVLSTVLRV